jgi:hypothetical protein
LDEGFGGRDEGSGGIVLTGSSSLRSWLRNGNVEIDLILMFFDFVIIERAIPDAIGLTGVTNYEKRRLTMSYLFNQICINCRN